MGFVDRAMVGFHRDEEGDWVAELECGHTQHVRHRPPFQPRPWVVDDEQRRSRLGAPLECPLCDRAEMPDGLQYVRSSEVWDETSAPAGLRRDHRLATGTWGRLQVTDGQLTFVPGSGWEADGPAQLGTGSSQTIPPAMAHHVELDGPVRFRIDFYRVPPPGSDEGGEAVCMAPLVCDDCGALVNRPDSHRPGCPSAGQVGRTAL